MAATWTQEGKTAVIYDLAQVTPRDWSNLRVGLGEASPSGEDITLTDLTECTLSGYARADYGSAGWSNGDTSDTITINADPGAAFIFDAYVAPVVTINNMFVVDNTDDTILYYEVIPARPIDVIGDAFSLLMTLGDNTLPLP